MYRDERLAVANDVKALMAQWRHAPNDRALWSVLADALEESPCGLFVATREGVYRRIIGVFERLDAAILAGVAEIEKEAGHYYRAQVQQIALGDVHHDNERLLAVLVWKPDDANDASGPGRVICEAGGLRLLQDDHFAMPRG